VSESCANRLGFLDVGGRFETSKLLGFPDGVIDEIPVANDNAIPVEVLDEFDAIRAECFLDESKALLACALGATPSAVPKPGQSD
jgi:hypothetical protein